MAAGAIAAAVAALDSLATTGLDAEDRRAEATMRDTLERLASGDPAYTVAVDESTTERDDRPADVVLASEGLAVLTTRTTAAYTRRPRRSTSATSPTDRLDVFGAWRPSPTRADDVLFLALEPLWRAVDGDGGPTSPYRVAAGASAEAWRRDGSPVDANARALGIDPADVEPWLRAILETWREVAVGGPVEPWDERFQTGAFSRAMDRELPPAELGRINHAYYASLGADPAALGIRYDMAPRPGRGPVPVAFMLDVDVPRRAGAGWTRGEQWVFASYSRPRVPDLGELLHETGHAIHSRAIRTRPAFAVLRELLDDADRGARRPRRLGPLRARVAGALLRSGPAARGRPAGALRRRRPRRRLVAVRDRAPPDARTCPERVWTEITAAYLGVSRTPSGRGGRSAASSSRRPATWSTTGSERSSPPTCGPGCASCAATGSVATRAGTRRSARPSTAGAASASPATSWRSSSVGRSRRPRSWPICAGWPDPPEP